MQEIINSYGIALAAFYLVITLPTVYIATKNEKKPFLLQWVTVIVLLPVIGVVSYLVTYFTRKKHKKQFEALLSNESDGKKSTDYISQKNALDMPQEVVTHILECLDIFEKEKDYLKPDITLTTLAETFDTDSRYLSKVIKAYKKKSFKAYLNILRIDYLVEKIRSGDNLRKYTSKAAARQLGFSSATSFSLAFLRRTGMYHYPFVEQFETDEEEEQWAF